MISTENAFDMLPYVADIYNKLDLKGYIIKNKITLKENENLKTIMLTVGFDMFSYICKNTPKIKKEVFEIVALAEDKTVEEVKAQPFSKTYKSFKEVFEDKDTMDFFKEAMK